MTDINMSISGNNPVNLAGLELRGNVPITPRTMTFLRARGGEVIQENGVITLHGNFSFTPEEVEIFLKERQEGQQVAPKPAAKPAPHF